VLTLTRSVGETIRIGDDIEVHVVEVRGGTVRLGFTAPREVTIHREEVYRQIAEANLLAAQVTADTLGALAAFAPAAADAEKSDAGESGAVPGPGQGAEPAAAAPAGHGRVAHGSAG
jgi:carbon storage regulator